MLVAGLFVVILILALLAVIPQARRAMSTRKGLVVAIALGFLGVVFFHPYVFGLPGRLAETSFQEQIRPGMTRSQVIALARKYGGKTPFFSDLEPYVRGPDGALNVFFVDWATFCVGNGNNYSFYFRPNSKLRSWKVERLGNAC
jgi:hypothetical protein